MATEDTKTSQNRGRSHFALIAGGCASSASFFGKLSGEIDGAGQLNVWILRITCISLMIASNALVWTFYVKALHSKGGTLRATVMSAATNYFVSYVLGILVFHEDITLWKVIGMILILCGLVLIVKDAGDSDDVNQKVQ